MPGTVVTTAATAAMLTGTVVDTAPTTETGSTRHGTPAVTSTAGDPVVPAAWITLTEAGRSGPARPLSSRRLVAQLVVGVLVVLVVVTLGGAWASRRLAEREAVNDAARTADVLAEAVVQPAVSDALVDGDPAARTTFDRLVRDRILGEEVVRVRLWNPDGTVAYADQRSLEGRHFGLEDDEVEALRNSRTEAEISDLSRPENALDRAQGRKLVEVYRPVWTPSGRTALFEIYEPYDQVSQRTGQLWRGFAGVTLTSLLLFVILLVPVLGHLLGRARQAQRERVLALQRAVDASADERRRIAASLHDGPVQDLAATSFVVAGATAGAEAAGQERLVGELRTVAGSVRTSMRALRTLLVDIYPPSLSRAGLGAALADLAQSVRTSGLEVRLETPDVDGLGLSPTQERVIYRVAQETVRNAVKHAAPGVAVIRVSSSGEAGSQAAVLDVVDDGPGFDVAEALAAGRPGHLGMQLLIDTATEAGAELQVASALGVGTHWRLSVPRTEEDTER